MKATNDTGIGIIDLTAFLPPANPNDPNEYRSAIVKTDQWGRIVVQPKAGESTGDFRIGFFSPEASILADPLGSARGTVVGGVTVTAIPA